MPSKYMDLDNLLLYEPRRKGSLPYKFKQYELSNVNILSEKVENYSYNGHVEKSKTNSVEKPKLKKQPKGLLPTTKASKNSQIIKKQRNKNNVSKKNKLSCTGTKTKCKNDNVKKIKTCDKPNFKLNFYGKKLFENNIFGNTVNVLQHKVHFKECKPISDSWKNYNIIHSVVNRKVSKSKGKHEIETFLKFQPIVLVQKLDHKSLMAYSSINDAGSPMSLWKDICLPDCKFDTAKFECWPATESNYELSTSFNSQNQQLNETNSESEENIKVSPAFEEIEIEEDKSWFKDFNFNSL